MSLTTVAFHEDTVDAFGRLRVGHPQTIFDSKQLHDKAPLYFDESITNTSGNAASTHVPADALVTMYVEAQDEIVRQTRQTFNYQPGKSQAVLMTGVLTSGGTGVTGRIGPHDASNGLFFEVSGTTVSVGKRKGGADTTVAQADWNLDTLDGTGPSGVNVDWDKAAIFGFDYEWLGVGRVRYFIVVGGETVYCHEFTHAPVADGDDTLTAAYMSTPNLPLRYSIASAAGGASVTMKHICSTVISEGGSPALGTVTRVSTGGTHINAETVNVRYPVIGVRLSTGYPDVTLIVEDASLINEQNGDFEWFLGVNPNSITNSSKIVWSESTFGKYQVATGSSSISLPSTAKFELEIVGGFEKSGAQAGGSANVHGETVFRPGTKLDGTRDQFWLVARPLAANADMQGSIQVRRLA